MHQIEIFTEDGWLRTAYPQDRLTAEAMGVIVGPARLGKTLAIEHALQTSIARARTSRRVDELLFVASNTLDR